MNAEEGKQSVITRREVPSKSFLGHESINGTIRPVVVTEVLGRIFENPLTDLIEEAEFPPRLYSPPHVAQMNGFDIEEILRAREQRGKGVDSQSIATKLREKIIRRPKSLLIFGGIGMVTLLVLLFSMPPSGQQKAMDVPQNKYSPSQGPTQEPFLANSSSTLESSEKAGLSAIEPADYLRGLIAKPDEDPLGRAFVAEFKVSQGSSLAIRQMSESGDFQLLMVCAVAASGEPHCRHVTLANSPKGFKLREIVQPDVKTTSG